MYVFVYVYIYIYMYVCMYAVYVYIYIIYIDTNQKIVNANGDALKVTGYDVETLKHLSSTKLLAANTSFYDHYNQGIPIHTLIKNKNGKFEKAALLVSPAVKNNIFQAYRLGKNHLKLFLLL